MYSANICYVTPKMISNIKLFLVQSLESYNFIASRVLGVGGGVDASFRRV